LFLEESASMSPEIINMHFESGSTLVTHETSAHEGQTEAPNIDEKNNLRFIAIALSAVRH
uniref:Ubiquitin C-terminal hydrolase isozyme L2, UCH-L2 (Fragments) n=1 Tax=Bos taurus TaxID=9913 RepID=Q9TSA4_BOVIN